MNEEEDIQELSKNEKIPSHGKRSGMVIKTSGEESLFSDVDELSKEDEEVEDVLKEKEAKLLKLKKKIDDAFVIVEKKQKALEEEREKFEKLKEEIEKREKKIKEKERELEKKLEENEKIRKELEEKWSEVEAREKSLAEKGRELAEREAKVEEMMRSLTEKEREISEKESFIQLSKKELGERDARIKESKSYLKAELERITAEKNGIENENRRLRKEKMRLEEEKKRFERKLEALKRKEMKILEKERLLEKTLQEMKKGEDKEAKMWKEMEKKEEELAKERAEVERLKNVLESEKMKLDLERIEVEKLKERLKEKEKEIEKKKVELEEEYERKLLEIGREVASSVVAQEEIDVSDVAPLQEKSEPKEFEFGELEELKSVSEDQETISALIEELRSEKEEEMSVQQESEVDAEVETGEDQDFEEETTATNIKDEGEDLFTEEMSSEIMSVANLTEEEKEKKIQQYRSIIQHFKEKGYNVVKMIRIVETKDFNFIREKMLDFMEKIQRLKEIEKELNNIDPEGFEETIHVIRTKLKDPEALYRIEKTMASLRKKVEERERKKMEEKMKALEKVKELFHNLQEKYDLSEYQDEVFDIRSKIDNPDLLEIPDISKLSSQIKKLENALYEKKQKEREARLEETLKIEVQNFKKKGYKVADLERALTRDIKEAEKLYLDYLANIDRLEELKKSLEEMNTIGFEKEVESIKKQMRDPAKVEYVEDEINSLKRKIRLKRIRELDLRLRARKEEEEEMKPSFSLNLGKEKVEELHTLSSEKEKDITISTGELKSQAVAPEKPKVKICPKCKKGRIVIPPKVRPVRVSCQSCGQEFLITSEKGADERKEELKHPFDAQDYTTELSKEKFEEEEKLVKEGKCPSCGAQLIEGSEFCGFCGYNVKKYLSK